MYGISCNLGYISCPIVVIGLCMSCRSNNTTTIYDLAVISIRGFFRHLVPQMEYFHTSMKYCLPILFTICWLCISAGRNLRANFGPWLLSGWKKLPSPPTAIQTPTPSPQPHPPWPLQNRGTLWGFRPLASLLSFNHLSTIPDITFLADNRQVLLSWIIWFYI